VSFHLHRYLGLAAGKQTKEAFWPKPCSRASKQHVNSNPEHANISHYCTIEPQMKPRIYQTRSCCSCIGDRKLKNGNCRFSLAVGFISDCPFIIFFFKNSVHHLIVLLSVKWLPVPLLTMLHLYHHHLRRFLFFAIPSSPPA
jgi:hypothetical protein